MGGKCTTEYWKRWEARYKMRPGVMEKRAERMRKYNQDPILKVRKQARRKVRTAIKNGSLTPQPCFCGAIKVHAHHDDYSKPLDVKWLCFIHHRQVHAQASGESK